MRCPGGQATRSPLRQQCRPQEIVDNLLEAGFPADDITVVDDVVYVGRDAAVSLAASREMLQAGTSSEEQYRTANTVSSSLTKICVNGSTFTGVFSTALDLAIQNYDQLPLTFAMARTPSSDCSFTINAVIAPGAPGGVAGFPSGGLPYSTITIFSGLGTYSVDTIEHVITHELGHAVGLRHTDFFNRAISCGSGGNEGDAGVGAIHIPGTPTGATVGGSIMNSCFRSNETGEFTSSDVTALRALYLAGWSGTEAMASSSGYVYATQGGRLRRVEVSTGAVVPFGDDSSSWSGTEAMAASGGYLYAVQGGTLWRESLSTGAVGPFSSAPTGWSGTEGMAADGGALYAIQGGTLWRVDLSTGAVGPFSSAPIGWSGTEGMAADGGALYVIQGGTLWRVDLSTGAVGPFSSNPNGWSGTEAMAADGGALYAIQGDTLWRVVVSTGAVAPFSSYPTGWSGTQAMTALGGSVYAAQGGVLWRVSASNGSVGVFSN